MANNTWVSNRITGGQYASPLETVTFKFVDTQPISISGENVGIFLPGFQATQAYTDESWLLTGSLSFGFIDITIPNIGFYADANPQHPTNPHDPKRVTTARYKYDTPTTAGTEFQTTWEAYTWFDPPGIGITQAFSLYFTEFATAYGPPAGGFFPDSGHFTLERYLMGPSFKRKERTIPVIVQA